MGATLRIEIFPADLDAVAIFYTEVLAFTIVRDERDGPHGYLALQRGEVHIGAARRDEPQNLPGRRPPSGIEVVLEVDDLDIEYARVTGHGWPIEEGMLERPWGLRDFRILDPAGYYLRLTTKERS